MKHKVALVELSFKVTGHRDAVAGTPYEVYAIIRLTEDDTYLAESQAVGDDMSCGSGICVSIPHNGTPEKTFRMIVVLNVGIDDSITLANRDS